jgi:hypothetical protein
VAASGRVEGFLPSTSAFKFPNSFPHVPLRRIGVPGLVSVPIGDAANGLCGGMAFAARDLFEADRTPPPDTDPPAEGTPLFAHLVERLFASFDLPIGPVRYLELMNPALPDGETIWSRIGLAPHGRAWRNATQEWPKVRADIDAGHPSPLGLVRTISTDPFDLKQNHQVLAYAYEASPDTVTLRIYDPNLPARDDVTLRFEPSPAATAQPLVRRDPLGAPIHAFFRVPYRPARPPD